MDITQLYYFKAVAEAENFTRAAESLHVTQSALSKSIAKLEGEIGLKLFEREGNRITLNRFGKRFLTDAERSLAQLSDGVRAAREMAGLESGEVRIAISKEIFVDHIIMQFLTDHPGVSFYCYLLSPEQMWRALESGSIDLALTTERPEGRDLMWQPVYPDTLEVIVGKRHRLAGEKSVYLEDLRDERFVVTNVNYNMDDIINKLCLQAGFEPKIMYEGTSNDMPMAFISDCKAVMVTPRSITAGVREMIGVNQGIVNIPLVNNYPDICKYVGIAFKDGHYQSQATHEFYDRVLAFFSSLKEKSL